MKFTGRCHSCKVPLDPRIIVDNMSDYRQVLAWSNLTNINVVSNDSIYKFLGPHKVVRMC